MVTPTIAQPVHPPIEPDSGSIWFDGASDRPRAVLFASFLAFRKGAGEGRNGGSVSGGSRTVNDRRTILKSSDGFGLRTASLWWKAKCCSGSDQPNWMRR